MALASGVARVAVEPDLSFTPHVPEDAGDEKQRYSAAVAKFIEQTKAQIARMTETVGEEAAAIMGAHIEFAEDEGIVEMVNSFHRERHVRRAGCLRGL